MRKIIIKNELIMFIFCIISVTVTAYFNGTFDVSLLFRSAGAFGSLFFVLCNLWLFLVYHREKLITSGKEERVK